MRSIIPRCLILLQSKKFSTSILQIFLSAIKYLSLLSLARTRIDNLWALGVRIGAFAMLAIAVVGYLVFVGPDALNALYPFFFSMMTMDIFVAVPLFVFMAAMFQVSGLGGKMYDMYKWMAGLKGGLAIGKILICTLLAAITGVVATDTIIMGLLAYPEMRKCGYDKSLLIGSICAGGCLGPLIPSSVLMIIVSGLTSVSSGKLFMAGILPGLICSFLF
jgi:TRAP-type mannitol/chloroaromatic compound transport system permease large subunit